MDKTKAEKCITHHNACDCREYQRKLLLDVVRATVKYRQAQETCKGSDNSQHFIERARAGRALDATLQLLREAGGLDKEAPHD